MASALIIVLFTMSLFLPQVLAQSILDNTSEVASNILQQIQDHLGSVTNSGQARMGGYGGCTDSFSVFGFLAFLLALLDLVLELQGNRRKKRDILGTEDFDLKSECQSQEEVQQATSACYSLLRGFLNTLAAQDPECAKRFLCEGAEEAASAGPVGEVIASVGSTNAGSWLEKVNATLYQDVGSAGEVGARVRGCALRYSQCFALPSAYRYPGVYRNPHLPSSFYQPLLQNLMDTVRDTLL
ncbi:uncharacterized protein LOC122263061 [Penaeus japonicus]|uniref:uncharacterized protein LOC122263061 n=1 Tax=Penaeus japonicus TaxID=27405 RepID=UPI001C716DF2|nr:uncharacterized protein LOC122263061 [Penaeus japonicus]